MVSKYSALREEGIRIGELDDRLSLIGWKGVRRSLSMVLGYEYRAGVPYRPGDCDIADMA